MKRLGLGFLLLAACHVATTKGGDQSAADTSTNASATSLLDSAYGATGAASGTDVGTDAPIVAFSSNGRAVVLHAATPTISFRALLADGTADLASGANGDVSLSLPDAATIDAHAILEDDGTVVVYGSLESASGGEEPFIARIKNGAFDSGFATNGVLVFDDSQARVDSLAATHDASGATNGYYATLVYAEDPNDSSQAIAKLIHFDTSGALDTTFGETTFSVTDPRTESFPVTINAKGWPTVVRQSTCIVSRFTATGEPDPDFGPGGIALVPTEVIGCNAFEQPDGGMIVAISSKDTFVIEPLTAAGDFGSPLYSVPRLPLAVLSDVGADGTMLVDQQQGAELFDWDLVRLNADGTPDTTFPAFPALVNGVRILSNGEAMVGSSTPDLGNATSFKWTVQRLLATGQPTDPVDAGTPDAGPTDTDSGAPDSGTPDAAPPPRPAPAPYPPSDDSDDSTDQTPDLGDAGAFGQAHVTVGSPSIGCSSAPGGSSAGAPWLVLALAALATRRRRGRR